MMKHTLYAGGAACALIGSALVAGPAFAAGTPADTPIENTVTVQYEVGGVAQDPETAEDDVVVDRKVNLSVTEKGGAATSVVPGEDGAITVFTLVNTSNDALDFALDADNQAGGSAAHGGNDNFNTEGAFLIYEDTDKDGQIDASGPGASPITHLDAVAADEIVDLLVVADIPSGQDSGDIATVSLTATAREDNNAATLGGTLTQATTNTTGVDTIFADNDRDASESDIDDYEVDTADLQVTKSSRVVDSAVAGDNSGTYLPGSTIEYCILVENNSATVDATGVSISDNISALPITFVNQPVSGTAGDPSVAVGGADCLTPGSTAGSESGGTVSGTIGTVAAGGQASVIFRALID